MISVDMLIDGLTEGANRTLNNVVYKIRDKS